MPKTQAKRGLSPRELDALRKRYVAEQKQADSASKWQLANDIVSGINDIVGRGVIAPILGMPGDINQAIYDAGAFVNNKIKDVEVATGMVKQPRYVQPSQGNAYLGSEDIGSRMQQAGLVSSERRPMTELAASLVSPGAAAKTAINAPKTAMNMLRMAENLEAPSRGVRNAQGMYIPRGQMGAIENLWHGSPYEFDKFSADAREVGFRGDAFGKGAYAAEDVDVAKYFTEHGGGGTGDKGYLYNLRLAYPGEKEAKTPLGAEHFIDWDKPFEQQSQFVRDKITNLDEYDWLQTVNNALENNEGRYLYDAARSDFGSKKEASDALAKAGIPGMRYKEPGKDSYNYVVFDDKLIDIVSRNNQPIRKAEAPQAKVGIVWDRSKGIGNVPNQQELDYFGFERNMKPSEFRQYVPKGVWNKDTKSFLASETSKGKTVAPPFLKVEWDKENKAWRVSNHEGRSRADYSAELNADADIPVSMLPVGMRARDITPEMRSAPIIGQQDSPSYTEWSSKNKDKKK